MQHDLAVPLTNPAQSLSRRSFLMGGAAAAVIAGTATFTASPAGAAGLPPVRKYAPDVLTGWIRNVYGQVKAERFSPTSAARAYAYVSLAAYEAVVAGMPKHRSLSGQLNDLDPLPAASGLHWPIALNRAVALAADAAFADRSAASRTQLQDYATATHNAMAGGVPAQVVKRSWNYGTQIGTAIADRTRRDNYLETRGLPYTPPEGPDKWIRTPPNFGASLEPHWGQIRSFTLRTNDECKPPPPVAYSETVNSAFWQQAKATYDSVNNLTDARRTVALSWRDNPDGTSGLPSGHWMLIACIAIDKRGVGLDRAAEILALTGLSLADGFTSCWTEKYQTNLLRPVTYIQRVVDPGWASFVNSPAFPEYTSGHSVGSGAAAETLTTLLGKMNFTDNTGLVNGYPEVRYRSFWEAANEAAVSRLYGGIHYPMGIEVGIVQGSEVSHKVLERAQTRR